MREHLRKHHERFHRARGQDPIADIRCYMGARLHRKLFAWFGIAIMMTMLTVSLSMRMLSGPEHSLGAQRDRIQRFAAHGFARVWDDPAQRSALARSYREDLNVAVSVTDVNGMLVAQSPNWQGESCGPTWTTRITRPDGTPLGTLRMCVSGFAWHAAPWRTLVTLFAAGLVLWAISNKVARRLVKPLEELTNVAQSLGNGDLSCRASLCHTHPGEVGELTRAINEMAVRIDRQLKEQRQLLAAVSHELRTPLARIRILTELARDGASAGEGRDPLDEIEAEVVEMDSLVGELLASARLEFSALSRRPLSARAVIERAADRASLPSGRTKVEPGTPMVDADPTLLARAIGALLDNARKYGGPTVSIVARPSDDGRVEISVEDDGDGFAPGEEERVFEPFFRGNRDGEQEARGVGLGLALVRRIAEAHGGKAWAENRAAGGARVVMVFPVAKITEATVERATGAAPSAAATAAE
ncbi:MAG: HAMP domain-containing histidine kinase [Myxococcales bacterium]|nr:HAMP domain-containing histidine kinase [Myxococcales bacterium]